MGWLRLCLMTFTGPRRRAGGGAVNLGHNAVRLLDGLAGAAIAIELKHRSNRRLFGLRPMAPVAEAVRPPYRPEPGRGRPPILVQGWSCRGGIRTKPQDATCGAAIM